VDRTAARGDEAPRLGERWAVWWRRLLMNFLAELFFFFGLASDGVLGFGHSYGHRHLVAS
jgi:hypothetical protein